jgi:hypothetical protein
VFAKRLAKVMDTIISSNQCAFIKGRNLVDGVLVVNEVVDWVKKAKKECIIFKVDFEKAYDSVDWGFLEYMLHRCGFCGKWIEWMRACVFAGNLSVLVNGSPTGEINIQRGLKQGDPLAPFLFLIVVEGFSGIMRNAVNMGLFKGVSVGNTPVDISHLQYADDTLCFGEASVDNLWTLKAILRGYEMASGLKVNFWKSSLMGVNVSSTFLEMASSFLNCRLGSIRKGFLLIWHATLWSIWKARNGAIFSSGIFSPRAIVEDIKVLSWKWSLARVKMVPCMFYEWTWDPGDCLLRLSFG